MTAELINQDVPDPISGLININRPEEESDPLAVTDDTTNPAFLGLPGGTQPPAVDDSVTREFALTVAEDAALGQQLALQAEAVLQADTDEFDTTTTQTVTITDQQAPVEGFDINGEPGIQGDEVLDAISEFNEGGDVEPGDVLDVISAFNETSGRGLPI